MRLSIIVPVYNGERYLPECLNSIAGQEFKDCELIIVDDGSTDKTEKIIDDFIKDNEELSIRKIKKENGGLSQARKTGVENAAGEYTGFVDADDKIDKNYFADMMHEALKNGADIVSADLIKEKGRKKRFVTQHIASGSKKMIGPVEAETAIYDRKAVFQYAWNKIYKTDILRKAEYLKDNIIGEDFYLSIQAVGNAKKIFISDVKGYRYRIHEGNMTQGGFNYERREGFFEYKKFFDAFDKGEKEKKALTRYLMLEYMNCIINMFRSGIYDEDIADYILSFIKENRADYIKNSNDGTAAKIFARIINKKTAGMFMRVWANKISGK